MRWNHMQRQATNFNANGLWLNYTRNLHPKVQSKEIFMVRLNCVEYFGIYLCTKRAMMWVIFNAISWQEASHTSFINPDIFLSIMRVPIRMKKEITFGAKLKPLWAFFVIKGYSKIHTKMLIECNSLKTKAFQVTDVVFVHVRIKKFLLKWQFSLAWNNSLITYMGFKVSVTFHLSIYSFHSYPKPNLPCTLPMTGCLLQNILNLNLAWFGKDVSLGKEKAFPVGTSLWWPETKCLIEKTTFKGDKHYGWETFTFKTP